MRRPLLGFINFDRNDGWTLAVMLGVLALWSVWGHVSWIVVPVLIAVGALLVVGLIAAALPERFFGGKGKEPEGAEVAQRVRRAAVSDPAFRVRVIDRSDPPGGVARIVGEVFERGATDVSEPEVVPVLVLSESPGALARRGAVSLAIGAAAAVGVKMGFGVGIRATFLYVDLLVALCVARFAWGFVWPTYARIVPGRLDLLRYGFLGSGTPTVEVFDLRTARLLLTEVGRVLVQRDACDEGVWLSGRRGIEAAVLGAAFSRFSPPPLEERVRESPARRERLAAAASAPLTAISEDGPPEGSAPWFEPVHLAGMVAPEDRRSLWRNLFRAFNVDLVPEWAAGAAVVALVGIGAMLANGSLVRGQVTMLGAVALVGAGGMWLWRAKDLRYSEAHAHESDRRRRLRVTGWESVIPSAEGVIARARATGGREFSEPEEFRITHAAEAPAEFAFRAGACLAVASLGLALIRVVFAPHLPLVGSGVLGLLLVLMITRAVWGFLWPTVVRVIPGRLEVVRSPLLGLGRASVSAYDLRTARVLIDLRYGRVFLQHEEEGPDGEGEWLSGVMGRSVRGGQEMGLAVLAAALSAFEAPEGESREAM